VAGLLLAVTAVAACGSSGDDAGRSDATTTTAAATKGQRSSSPPASGVESATVSAEPLPDVGQASGDTNIVGGQPLAIADAPWLVALVQHSPRSADQAQFCGGALVATQLVLTAAHCLDVTPNGSGGVTGTPPASIDVVIGRTDLDETGGDRIQVSSYKLPQKWDGNPVHGSDMALLQLSRPTTQTARLLLPAQGDTYGTQGGQTARVQGWGCHKSKDEAPTRQDCRTARQAGEKRVLRVGTVEFKPQTACSAESPAFSVPNDLCGAGLNGEAVDCYGDSGGPLTVPLNDGTTAAFGIVSYGIGENASGEPTCGTNQLSAYTHVLNVWNAWQQGGSWVFGGS
jgi:secreted trypsin-like serine protease